MELFSISCTTCGARLKVRSMAAIGQILACPKCQSMVEVAAPAGWSSPAANGAPADVASVPAAPLRGMSGPLRGMSGKAAADSHRQAAAPATVQLVPGACDSDFATSPPEPPVHEAAAVDPEAAPPLGTIGISPVERAWKRGRVAALSVAAVTMLLFAVVRSQSDSEPAQTPAKTVVSVETVVQKAPDPRAAAHTDAKSAAADAPAEKPPAQLSDEPPQPAISDLASPSNKALPHREKNAAVEPGDENQPAAEPAPPPSTVTPPAEAIADQTTHAPAADRSAASEATELTSELSVVDRQAMARLEERLAAIDFQKSKLSDLVEFLARMGNVGIEFDSASLVAAGVEPSVLVSVKQSDTDIARVLDAVLGKLGLKHEIRDGQVLIVTRPDTGARRQPTAERDSPPSEPADASKESQPSARSDLRLPAAKP